MEWIRLMMVVILVVCLHFETALCGATLNIRLIEYLNPGGLSETGEYCDGRFDRTSYCDYVFKLCLDRENASSGNMRQCPYGRMETGRTMNQDSVLFGSDIGGTPNPMRKTFSEWPGSLYLKVRVNDFDLMGPWDNVDYLQQLIQLRAAPSLARASETKFIISGRTKLKIGILVHCDDGYYGETCTRHCVPTNSELGHYGCNDKGEKICQEGWTGVDCAEATNECGQEICLNGGTCVDLHNEYSCACPPGFQGRNCEINVNECESRPCLHGGVCLDGANGYTCVCDMNFEGDNCETPTDPCIIQDQCANNGRCHRVGLLDYRCECQENYFGENCEYRTTTVPTEKLTTAIMTTTMLIPTKKLTSATPTVQSGSDVSTSNIILTTVVDPTDYADMVKGDWTLNITVSLSVARSMSDAEIVSLRRWTIGRLSSMDHVNMSNIVVRITKRTCLRSNGETVTELNVFLHFSILNATQKYEDIAEAKIKQSLRARYKHLYRESQTDCASEQAPAHKPMNWADAKWLAPAAVVAYVLLIIVIGIVVVKCRRGRSNERGRHRPTGVPPNDFWENPAIPPQPTPPPLPLPTPPLPMTLMPPPPIPIADATLPPLPTALSSYENFSHTGRGDDDDNENSQYLNDADVLYLSVVE